MGLSVLGELHSARRASDRLMEALRKELDGYRVVMIEPGMFVPPAGPPRNPSSNAPPARPPAPLATPDPRYLRSLDPGLLDVVKENPGIEGVITRELVRDIDSKVLDLSKLLRHSALSIRFDVDEEGRTHRSRITSSSGVPSLDHLALELVRLLDKYGLLASLRGLRSVTASITVANEIAVTIDGRLSEGTAGDEMRGKVLTLLTLARFSLAREAAFLLQEVSVEAAGDRIRLSRVYPKEPLVAFLTDYFRSNAAAAAEAAPVPPRQD